MNPRDLIDYEWRMKIFLKKYQNMEPFVMTNNAKMKFAFDEDALNALKSKLVSRIREIKFLGQDGKNYRITSFKLNEEFGDKFQNNKMINPKRKEDYELQSLQKQLEGIKTKIVSPTVPIRIGNKTFDVLEIMTTPGVPKSDFHFTDIHGKEIVWCSHKDGKKPIHFVNGEEYRIEREQLSRITEK
jgi:hypothetical protein